MGKLEAIRDYCDLFNNIQFTLELHGIRSKPWCSIENREDLMCVQVDQHQFKIACFQTRLTLPENRNRNLTEVVLRLDSEECLLRHVFKIPTFGR